MSFKSTTAIVLFISVVFSTACQAAVLTYGIIGDAGRTNSNSKTVRESMIRNKVFKTILPGDNLYSGTYLNVWAPWKSAGFSFDIVAIGNHNSGYANEVQFFQMPAEYYSKSISGAKFIVLNSDNTSTVNEQIKWLDSELSRAIEKNIFLVYHHPTYTISKVHRWTEKRNFQLALRPLIWKYRSKLTALIVGHDHLASLIHFNDLPVILSGAVQEVRNDRPVKYDEGSVHIETAWYFDSTPAWARMEIDTAKNITQVYFYRAQNDQISCTVKIQTGLPAQLGKDCSQQLSEY